MLLELVVYFALALGAATLVVQMPWAPRAGPRAGVPLGLGIVAATGWAAAVATHDVAAGEALSIVALAGWAATWWRLKRWGALSALLYAMLLVAAVAYLLYAAVQSVTQSANPLVIIASLALLVLEAAALALTATYAFEILDVLGRRELRGRPLPAVDDEDLPWVALQIPTYNEPIDVLRPTLE